MAFHIYPNPSYGLFNIESLGIDGETRVSVINVNGLEVFNKTIHLTTTGFKDELNLSDLKTGMYYIRFQGDGFLYAEKIIIK
jgi:hypothetical protein